MSTIIPAPTTVIRIQDMGATLKRKQLRRAALQTTQDLCAFIATVTFICCVAAICIMLKSS